MRKKAPGRKANSPAYPAVRPSYVWSEWSNIPSAHQPGLCLPEGVKTQHDDALYGQVVEVARTTHDEETLGENVSGVPMNAFVLSKADGLTVPCRTLM